MGRGRARSCRARETPAEGLDDPRLARGPRDLLAAGGFAYGENRHVTSVQLFRAAIARGASSSHNLRVGYRYDAACSAALAAAGKGAGARELSLEQRSNLRTQAVRWLRTDLAAWQKAVAEHEKARAVAIKST